MNMGMGMKMSMPGKKALSKKPRVKIGYKAKSSGSKSVKGPSFGFGKVGY